MWKPFTERARRSIVLAQEEAMKLGHGYIGTEHMLLGILTEGDSKAAIACKAAGITYEAALKIVMELVAPGTTRYEGDLIFTPRAKRVVELAFEEGRKRHENYVGTEHLFIAIYREGEGVGYRALVELGLDKVLVSLSNGELQP